MNYLHNIRMIRSPSPISIYSCILILSRTLSRNALLYLAFLLSAFLSCVCFFFLLLITLHRNIFVLGPAQLCISRNDDGSYDVTVLAGRRGLGSKKRERLSLEENRRMRFQWLTIPYPARFSLWIHVTVNKRHLGLFRRDGI